MEKSNYKVGWPKEAVLKLIEEWRENECLYNPKHGLYRSKMERAKVIQKIANILQDACPGLEVPPAEVRLKMQYLRGQYSREAGKKRYCKSNDPGYDANPYWFTQMSFLRKYVKHFSKHRKNVSTLRNGTLKQENTEFDMDAEMPDSCPSPSSIKNLQDSFEPSAASPSDDSYVDPLHGAGALPLSQTNFVQNAPAISIDESFAQYIRDEMGSIQDDDLKEELREQIISLVFEMKRKYRKLIR